MTVLLRADAEPSTPALLLRPWRDEDADALIDAYRDPVLRRWTRLPVEDRDDAARWLDVQRQGWVDGTRYSFAVLEAATAADRLVANVAVKRGEPGRPFAEVGYWTAAPARGRGVAPRALELMSVWAFDHLAADGLRRLELLHQVDNPASCRVAEKCDYAFVEVLPARPPFPRDGHRHVRHAA